MISSDETLTDFAARAEALLREMTVDEKATLLSGDGWWKTHAIERLQIPALSLSDGPHGLRKVDGAAFGKSVPSTCFPTASALGSSWDPELAEQIGGALAEEAQANDVQILLGPGVNMKRSPLAGRNFEYLAEDPVLAGKMAAAYIRGLQSQGVGASLKHYAANNQEFERMATSSNLDERTLHEIYLPAFELAVKEAQPWSVMAAYNPVNHVFATESALLLQEILRKRWGFTGFVVSDWGAVHDGVAGIQAGLSLEMPGSGNYLRDKILAAVADGRLTPAQLDAVLGPLLSVILQAHHLRRGGATFDREEHHALARRAAAESFVLLKNEGNLLPLALGESQKVALIGAFAKAPRYQGAGSSQVNPTRIDVPGEALEKLGAKITYAAGYTAEGATDRELIRAAQEAAQAADVAIVLAGLPDSYESEGFDRASLDLPVGHNQLIEAVRAVQPRLVVVLMNGAPVTMPWAEQVPAIVEAWLGGQAAGGALAEVLAGKTNFCGKLAETFPVRLEDTPCYPGFPGRDQEADYGEGLFIGYRHYEMRKIEPLYPFGFGLSYTQFAYTGLRLSASTFQDSEGVTAELDVKNTGQIFGKEVVQLYVRETNPQVPRPPKELKAFAKIALEAGEQRTVRFALDQRAFAHYDPQLHQWIVHPGTFEVLAGGSSQDLPLRQTVTVEVAQQPRASLCRDSMLKDFLTHPKGKMFYPKLLEAFGLRPSDLPEEVAPDLSPDELVARKKAEMATQAFLNDMPVYKVLAFSEGRFTEEALAEILRQAQ